MSPSLLPVLLVAAKTATLVFGGVITFLAIRAFRRTGSRALRALAIGVGLLTAGALVGGLLHQLADVSLELGVVVQSVFTAVGFAVLTYSLYTDEDTSVLTTTVRLARSND